MSTESHAIQQAAAEFIRDRHLLGAFVNGLLRDVHAAEDVLQEVWVLLSAELEKGTRIQNQAAWCRGVARKVSLLSPRGGEAFRGTWCQIGAARCIRSELGDRSAKDMLKVASLR